MRQVMTAVLGWWCLTACGPGAPSALCGQGTRELAGVCVVANEVRCGAGTELQGSECLVLATAGQVRCGAGTRLEGSDCVAPPELNCAAGTVREGTSCVTSGPAVTCGAGTNLSGAQCVANQTGPGVSCGQGTTLVGSTCRANFGGICGTDTQLGNNGTQCLGRVQCGAGTSRAGDACVASVSCGANTSSVGGQCVPSLSAICGANTQASGSQCVASSGGGGGGGSNLSLASFGSATGLNRAYRMSSYSRRTVISTLPTSQLQAWVQAGASPVGTSPALHVRGDYSNFQYGLDVGDASILPIEDDSTVGGGCTQRAPDSAPSSNFARVTFHQWAGGTQTKGACAKAGSVEFKRTASDTMELTLNVAFNDGSVWQDKKYSVSIPGGPF